MKKHFLLLVLLVHFPVFSQPGITHTFGKPSGTEIKMTGYDKEPEASAVYLYEKGNVYFQEKENRIWIVNEYYAKIKVFDVATFDASVEIPYYTSETFGQRFENFEAHSITDGEMYQVDSAEVYTKHEYGRWHSKVFAFNTVQDGSILEYRYTIASPYHMAFEDWQFQGSLPKLYSEFSANIPFNYVYRKFLMGEQKLDREISVIKRKCMVSSNFSVNADCEYLEFAMKDIPAFKKEAFMLSKKNYISRIVFKIKEYTNYFGRRIVYQKQWDKLDEDYNKNNKLQEELKYKNYFKNKLPKEIRKMPDDLERAKQVYAFFQDYYTWDEYYFNFENDIQLKKAFDQKSGSVDEINLALLNSLLALGYNAHVVLLSTRNNGLPNQIYTSFLEFDYLIVRLEIGDETYLLDATDKHTAFGILPYRCLNHFGRVMNDNGRSKWYDINTETSVKQISIHASLDADGQMTGVVKERSTSYFNRNKRNELNDLTDKEYSNVREKEFRNSTIITLKTNKESSNEIPLIEEFEFELALQKQGDFIFLNPYLYSFFETNPLTLEERNYPVNFAYKRNYIYQISLKIDPSFTISELPENKTVRIGDRTAELNYFISENENQIDLRLTFNIDKEEFPATAYKSLKDLFYSLVEIQNNSQLVLIKK